jgi:hypothetical protein
MPEDLKESIESAKPWAAATVQTKALVKARLAVDHVRLSRLATQSAIGRSRESIAATSAVLEAFKRDLQAALRRKVQRRINALNQTRESIRGPRRFS